MSLQITLIVLFSIFINGYTNATVKFTNLVCHTYDKPFATIPICELKVIGRNTVALNLLVKLHQLPVHNISMNLELLKKANGYRPFLYNKTEDFCKVMKQVRANKQLTFLKVTAEMVLKDSNINHTCPFNHDIIVQNLVVTQDMFKFLPLPNGEYLFNIRFAAYNDWKALVQLYLSFF